MGSVAMLSTAGLSTAGAIGESAPLAAACVPVPGADDDVCALCHGWTRRGYPVCFPCRLTAGQVSWPCRRVAPVSLYRPGGVLHQALRGYKDGPPATRAVLTRRVGALLARFLWERGPEVAPVGWDGLVVVPSTTGRPGGHPLEAALAAVGPLAAQLWPGTLRPGPAAVGHREAGDGGFSLGEGVDVAGARVVLLDDTWTTGARARSAASTLAAGGAEVQAVVVVGRVVTPVAGAPTGAWWERHVGAATSRG
jgi:hypothetical protein